MGAEFLFMDDNARPHRANIVDECLQSEDITRMVQGNGLWLARIFGPPTALISEAISEPHLPSKEANRLRPAFVADKGKVLERLGPPRSM
ncbi:hypothetical protein AVEN_105186-1 [Araneus ventricosus]|uniref:Tc1-like transposase DDE domain-containing protein n=1 Tax=Araneus ventricosus TaxID=182803 RepID=A0A4Y2LI20_ARAVE|nr:hypothetical protein AVEN_105186-1 [Araneus ventricosus]